VFLQTFNGKIWEKFNSGKVASLAYAEIQGKSALASYMQTPSSMKEEKQLFPEVSYHDEGQDANDHVCLSDSKFLFLFCFWYMDSKCICSLFRFIHRFHLVFMDHTGATFFKHLEHNRAWFRLVLHNGSYRKSEGER